MHTANIITRSGSTFTVTQVEYDPHTIQGAAELQNALNTAALQGVVMQVISVPK